MQLFSTNRKWFSKYDLSRYSNSVKSFGKEMVESLIHLCHQEKLSVQIISADGIALDFTKWIVKFVIVRGYLVRRRVNIEVKITAENYLFRINFFEITTNF